MADHPGFQFEGELSYPNASHFPGTVPSLVASTQSPSGGIKLGDTEFDPDWMLLGSEINEDGFNDVARTTINGDRFATSVRNDDANPIADMDLETNPTYFSSTYSLYTGSASDWQGTKVTGLESINLNRELFPVDNDFLISVSTPGDFSSDGVVKLYRTNEQNQLEYVTETAGFIQWIQWVR